MLPEKELQENITTELHAIENEIELIQLILRKSELQEPDEIEVRAAASCLHSVYNGYENIFKLIAKQIQVHIEPDHRWHKRLLDAMREVLLDKELFSTLEELLGFRHFFRHSYTFSLKWEYMESLMRAVPETNNKIRNLILDYLQKV